MPQYFISGYSDSPSTSVAVDILSRQIFSVIYSN
jgi:hypothetical protein